MPDPTCAQCGTALPPDGRFCASCGAVFVRPPLPPPQSLPAGAGDTLVDQSPTAVSAPAHATMFGFASPLSKPGGASSPPPSVSSPPSSVAAPSAPPIVAAPIVPVAPVVALSGPPAPPPPPQPAPAAQEPSRAAFKQTMLGMSATLPLANVPSPVALPPAPPPAPTPPSPASLAPAHSPAAHKGTMIGVALPGIAPLQASLPPEAPRRGPSSTMLGVALPGIAPVHNSAPAPAPAPKRSFGRTQPVLVPKPAPLVDDEPAIGPAPRVRKTGVPLAYVAGGVLGLVVVSGLLVALLWKGQSLVVVPRLDAQGRDEIHLTCDSCQDGTVAVLGEARATFKDHEADLSLATPLQVGDNALAINLDRPGWGRDEEVSVVVPIAFRIKADVSELTGPHPAVVVRVNAVSGTDVKVDGKPLKLDAKSEGTYTLDVSAQTTGWSDDLRLIDQSIPYSITTGAQGSAPAGEQKGTLPVRAGIATLHLDAPGLSSVIEGTSFRLAGHTVKGGKITANGQTVTVEADGSFSKMFDASPSGDTSVELRADGPQLASRSARFTVRHVASLEREAERRESAGWVAYDAILRDTTNSVGRESVVEGEVVDAKTVASQTIALIDDVRGCKAASPSGSPCLVRVVSTSEVPLVRGARFKVYGKVTSVLPPPSGGAAPVPVVQADFVVKGEKKR